MRVEANGIAINCEVEGEGPWLTMSHSLGSTSSMWDPQMALLTKSFKVLRYDTRGHGGSSAPAGEYSLSDLAADVRGLLGALGIERTHFVGLSMGGMIGQAFALEYPGAAQSLVLADTSSRWPDGAAKMWADRIATARGQGVGALAEGTLSRWFTEPYRAAHPDLIQRIGDDIRNTPVDGFVGCCHALAKLDFTDRLREIDCPALILVGEHDMATPVDAARTIQQNLRGSKLEVIASAAHLSNVEQAAEFNRLLSAFYASL